MLSTGEGEGEGSAGHVVHGHMHNRALALINRCVLLFSTVYVRYIGHRSWASDDSNNSIIMSHQPPRCLVRGSLSQPHCGISSPSCFTKNKLLQTLMNSFMVRTLSVRVVPK
jgi:hypothetical protein